MVSLFDVDKIPKCSPTPLLNFDTNIKQTTFSTQYDCPCLNTSSGLVSSVRIAIVFKMRGPGFKSQLGKVGGLFNQIMWGCLARL